MGPAVGDRVMELAGIVGAVGDNQANLFVKWHLVEQIGQDRCVTDMAPGDLPFRQICYANRLPGNGQPRSPVFPH